MMSLRDDDKDDGRLDCSIHLSQFFPIIIHILPFAHF